MLAALRSLGIRGLEQLGRAQSHASPATAEDRLPCRTPQRETGSFARIYGPRQWALNSAVECHLHTLSRPVESES
jgi:hypothetical protein